MSAAPANIYACQCVCKCGHQAIRGSAPVLCDSCYQEWIEAMDGHGTR